MALVVRHVVPCAVCLIWLGGAGKVTLRIVCERRNQKGFGRRRVEPKHPHARLEEMNAVVYGPTHSTAIGQRRRYGPL